MTVCMSKVGVVWHCPTFLCEEEFREKKTTLRIFKANTLFSCHKTIEPCVHKSFGNQKKFGPCKLPLTFTCATGA